MKTLKKLLVLSSILAGMVSGHALAEPGSPDGGVIDTRCDIALADLGGLDGH